ncbi:MAG TPA: SAM-dependent chlorinase/fluorinase [Solirubrobacteraceae bacterium]|nr:SAM-dependent chlorinase/fluorinase [Solirubrobacteraceae bacterium]
MEFVGVLHGVIAGICPQARVIDLSHEVPRQNILAGAAVLVHALPYLPVGVHVGVVDPTVGSDRRAVALRLADGRRLVGPDNGLLWPAAQRGGGVVEAVEISASPWRLERVTATFHGRDLFAPVAAHLAAGEPLTAGGEVVDPAGLVTLELPTATLEADTLIASVIGADHFGNVQLGAALADLGRLESPSGARFQVTLETGEVHTARHARAFSDGAPEELLLFEDSSAQLALACYRGSAAARLGLRGGETVRVRPAPER